jgi:hypothetical protein
MTFSSKFHTPIVHTETQKAAPNLFEILNQEHHLLETEQLPAVCTPLHRSASNHPSQNPAEQWRVTRSKLWPLCWSVSKGWHMTNLGRMSVLLLSYPIRSSRALKRVWENVIVQKLWTILGGILLICLTNLVRLVRVFRPHFAQNHQFYVYNQILIRSRPPMTLH